MKYYLHDSNSFNDEKITLLFMEFGYEGLGLFYTLLEKFAQQEKPIKTEVLKKQLSVGKKLEKVWRFMEQIELISSNNDETFNKQLLNYSETYQIKKQRTREKVAEWRKNQELEKNVTSYVPICNHPKVKESKVKEINNSDFEMFWNLYDKKRGDKEKIKNKWDKLPKETRQLIFDYIPKYKLSQPDKKYRKDPDTFLNNKSWLDELIMSKETKQAEPEFKLKTDYVQL